VVLECKVLTVSNLLLCSVFSVHITPFQAVISGMCLRRHIPVKSGGVRGKWGDELHRRKNEHEQNNLMDYWKINQKQKKTDWMTRVREGDKYKDRGMLSYNSVPMCSVHF